MHISIKKLHVPITLSNNKCFIYFKVRNLSSKNFEIANWKNNEHAC